VLHDAIRRFSDNCGELSGKLHRLEMTGEVARHEYLRSYAAATNSIMQFSRDIEPLVHRLPSKANLDARILRFMEDMDKVKVTPSGIEKVVTDRASMTALVASMDIAQIVALSSVSEEW
jgi:hypothetical protein